eukprot:246298-Chlamydomonas_euryale.AAC.1
MREKKGKRQAPLSLLFPHKNACRPHQYPHQTPDRRALLTPLLHTAGLHATAAHPPLWVGAPTCSLSAARFPPPSHTTRMHALMGPPPAV